MSRRCSRSSIRSTQGSGRSAGPSGDAGGRGRPSRMHIVNAEVIRDLTVLDHPHTEAREASPFQALRSAYMAPCARKAEPASSAHIAASVYTEIQEAGTGLAMCNLSAPRRLPRTGGARDRRLFLRLREMFGHNLRDRIMRSATPCWMGVRAARSNSPNSDQGLSRRRRLPDLVSTHCLSIGTRAAVVEVTGD